MRKGLIAGVLLLTSSVSLFAMASERLVLHKNPFVQLNLGPGATGTSSTTPGSDGSGFELRGTMLAGEHSMANIGGVIVEIGDEIDGYRLVEVQERQAVLERNGSVKTLTIEGETSEPGDD